MPKSVEKSSCLYPRQQIAASCPEPSKFPLVRLEQCCSAAVAGEIPPGKTIYPLLNYGRRKTISAGFEDSLALPTNGTIMDWGCFAPIFNLNQRESVNFPNVTAISREAYHYLALRGDGAVVARGENTYSETNVHTPA